MEALQQINPFALGGAFIEYCVDKGYLEIQMIENQVHYYLSKDGEFKLYQEFGIRLNDCAKIK